MPNPTRHCAWNGNAEEFWSAINRVRTGTDVEGDHAVLLDVIQEAMKAAELRALLDAVDVEVRSFGSDLELSAREAFAWSDRIRKALEGGKRA